LGACALRVLVALWLALRVFFTPFYRLRAKVGSWGDAWLIVSQAPGHWAAAVAVRALIGALLFWLALRCRRWGRPAAYSALAAAALTMVVADIVLWGSFQLG